MFEPRNPDYCERVRESFRRQRVMAEFGARLGRIEPGEVEIILPFRQELTQQHGFMHAGIVATILDSACGYAAFSLMAAEASVLSIEYKVNLLAPALGDELAARATVIRPGRNITVCRGDMFARQGQGESLIATMLGTIMAIYDRPDVRN